MILVSSYTESFRCNSHFTSWAQHYTFLLHDQSEIPKRKRNLADDPTVVSISILGSPATQQGYKFVSRGKNYFENLPKIPRSTRGISTFPNPGGSLGEEKINIKIYFWSLLTWGNHPRGQHQHQVPPGWGAQSWGSGRRGGEQSQPRAQGFAGKHIFL